MEINPNEVLALLKELPARELRSGLHGLEKESLRVTASGELALSPHPKSVSDPISDPHITTDFSESQIEFITAPHESINDALYQLHDLHEHVWTNLQNGELLWPLSMPCELPEDPNAIPIAQYGNSEDGKRRSQYREGLAHRYGKTMQTLCGIHYNFSFGVELWKALHQALEPEESFQSFKNKRSLALVRNFARYRWLLVALFGAAPLCDESYTCKAAKHNKGMASSLRMSKCGYTNPAEIKINYNHFDAHLQSIEDALNTHHDDYEGAGLNANLLQIPNEYYFAIRLKPHADTADNLTGLKEKGVEYFEVRLFDLNPYEFTGINEFTIRFTHLFLMACLLSPSPELSDEELKASTLKMEEIAIRGRDPKLKLRDEVRTVLKQLEKLAEAMGESYPETLQALMESEQWLSQEIVDDMEEHKEKHLQFGLRMIHNHLSDES